MGSRYCSSFVRVALTTPIPHFPRKLAARSSLRVQSGVHRESVTLRRLIYTTPIHTDHIRIRLVLHSAPRPYFMRVVEIRATSKAQFFFLHERSEIWPHSSAPFCLTQKEGSHSWNPPLASPRPGSPFRTKLESRWVKHMVVCKGSNVHFTRALCTPGQREKPPLPPSVPRMSGFHLSRCGPLFESEPK